MTYPPEGASDKNDLAYWLALLRAPGVGPITFMALLDHYATPRAIFEATQEQVASSGIRGAAALAAYLRKPDWAAVEKDLAWGELPGNHILALHDPAYPAQLREIADPPPLLFVHGNPAVLTTPQLALVGSRNPSAAGRDLAHDFARHLCGAGLTVTSGLALGIDAASHQGALDGEGLTIAVTGTGLDRVYPARHRDLAHRIAQRGALVSEFVPGTPPLAEHFPRRNRIISGLSLGTLVVEAALASGSLITARLAAEQGREVFAIPSSIHNPLARGCHALIRSGAKLVENVQDILEELGPMVSDMPYNAVSCSGENSVIGLDLDDNSLKLLDCVDFAPTSIDTLVERSGLTPEQVSSMLLVLELHNIVESASGGCYTRRVSG